MDDLIASLKALGVGMIIAVPYHLVSDIILRCNGIDIDCGDDAVACFHISIAQMKYTLACTGETSLVTRFL